MYAAFSGPWDSHRTFYHGHSYTGNALGCAAALLAFAWRPAWPLAALSISAALWVSVGGGDAYEVIAERRSFYGTLRVEARPNGVRHLVDGRVSHGFQYVDQPGRPTGYYDPRTGVGRVLAGLTSPRRVGVVGLGVGSLLAYGRPGDTFRVYELNPDVVDVAREHFTFLEGSAAKVDLVVGDARLRAAEEPPQRYDLLVLDAFTGDAVPVHLLTREAFDLWLRHLAPDGLLAVHASNHHLDLALLVAGQAKAAGLASAWSRSRVASRLGSYVSQWVLVGRAQRLDEVGFSPRPPPAVDEGRAAPVWTDNHAPLLPLVR